MVCGMMGVIYMVPGLLPLAAARTVRFGRIISGAGLVVLSAGRFTERPILQDIGLCAALLGLALFAAAILKQPCED
jgi:hypothetical protein